MSREQTRIGRPLTLPPSSHTVRDPLIRLPISPMTTGETLVWHVTSKRPWSVMRFPVQTTVTSAAESSSCLPAAGRVHEEHGSQCQKRIKTLLKGSVFTYLAFAYLPTNRGVVS